MNDPSGPGFVQGFVARGVGKSLGVPDSRRWTPSKPKASRFFKVIKPKSKTRDMLGMTDALMAKIEGEIPKEPRSRAPGKGIGGLDLFDPNLMLFV